MPWRETCTMDERLKFMAAWLESEEFSQQPVRAARDQPQDGVQVGGAVCRRS